MLIVQKYMGISCHILGASTVYIQVGVNASLDFLFIFFFF